jgi:pyruvate,water dikinase
MAVRWLENVSDDEERDVGKKAAALATLDEYGANTPRGFVVTAKTFEAFVRRNGLENQIESILSSADRTDPSSVKRAANRVRNLIRNTEIDDEVRDEIAEAYEKINMSEEVRNAGGDAVDLVGGQRETEFVAVRSSPTGSRFPGAHDTALNVNGKSAVVNQIKECWASLYAAEALALEEHTGTIHSMGVIVQRMVEPDVSGTIFGKHPVTGDDSSYVVESLWGLGTGLYDGSSVPDRFIVDTNGNVQEQEIVTKEWRIVRDPTSGENIKQRVSNGDREARSLQQSDISTVMDLMQKLEGRFGSGVRIDFVLSRNRLYALDMERLTDTEGTEIAASGQNRSGTRSSVEPLMTGRGAAPGQAVGTPRILYSDTDIEKVVEDDLLAAVNASERLLPMLPAVAGVITDKGGLASNMAAVARTLGTPCVVGAAQATDRLGSDSEITLDGAAGSIMEGDATGQPDRQHHQQPGHHEQAETTPVDQSTDMQDDALTATRVKVLGDRQHMQADGAVILDHADRRQLRDTAAAYHPDRIWVQTENPDVAQQHDTIGILTTHLHTDMAGKGAILSSYGGIMQSTNLVERGAAFIALDIDALQADGDRDALLNAIEKVGGETAIGCESALILRTLDPDIIQTAVEHGVDAITVPPEQVAAARREVAKAEKRFMLDRLRDL